MKKIHPQVRLIFFLTLGGFGITYFVCPNCANSVYNYTMVSIFSSLIWISLWIGNSWLAHWLNKKISWTSEPGKRFIWGLVSTVAYTIAVLYLLTIAFNWIMNANIALNGETLYYPIIITFAISAFMHGKEFLLNWRKAALDAETFKKESAIAQYEALRSQINPHFLFNSLNALTNLVYEDQDKAAKFIKQLSEVYRYVLDTREKELVSLEEELRFVNSFLYLQQIRFGNNLKVSINLENLKVRIAPLALQLLLENAIKHNVISTEDPLNIRVFDENNYICVENNLQKKSLIDENSGGLGLENIRNRYKFLSDGEVAITETSDKFLVKLPVIAEEV